MNQIMNNNNITVIAKPIFYAYDGALLVPQNFPLFPATNDILRQRLFVVVHAYYAVLAWPSRCSSPPSCSDLVALSKVFVVHYFHVVCLYYWRCILYSYILVILIDQAFLYKMARHCLSVFFMLCL